MAILRSVFLTASDPDRTARFYMDIAGLPLERVGPEDGYRYWKYDSGGVQFAIHDAEMFATYSNPPEQNSNLIHLYFQVADQSAFLNMLAEHNLTPRSVEEVNVVVDDPDGRKVLFGTA